MELGIEPVERRAHVLDFADPMIVLPFAQTGSPEVEAQYGKPKAVQRLHGVEDNFIVQCSAKQRMRMAHHSHVRGILRSCVQQRFQPSRRTVEEKGTNGTGGGNHYNRLHNPALR